MMKSIDEVSVTGKKVFLRADLDVPLIDGKVFDDTRIKASLPSINYLLENGARVIIGAHLGRPDGRVVEELRLTPVTDLLRRFIPGVIKANDCIGLTVEREAGQLRTGEVLLLENLRFHPEEERNNDNFAKELSSYADLYVNDCFSTSHRMHASFVGITKYLPSSAGLELGQIVRELGAWKNKITHPLIVIMGGAKIETKIPLIREFSKLADQVLVGGKLMGEISDRSDLGNGGLAENIILGSGGLDIDSSTINTFVNAINSAKTVIWNGPLGAYEKGEIVGTRAVAEAIIQSGCLSLVGGGDTVAILDQLGLTAKFSYACPAGGAFLEFLVGRKLPALEALGYYQ